LPIRFYELKKRCSVLIYFLFFFEKNFVMLLVVIISYFSKKKCKMDEHRALKTSRKLSYILRHNPEEIGLKLDAQGWGSVAYILDHLVIAGEKLTWKVLEETVATNDKKRFAFNTDKTLIRASQGHSVEIDLGYTPQTPPPYLFHGTVGQFLQSIKNQGLIKGSRHHVHLSVDEITARKVGNRRGQAVVLKIKAADMHNGGHSFYVSENGVWLVESVPVRFIVFP
jgi:putative RNA 2'-phosphotransferase